MILMTWLHTFIFLYLLLVSPLLRFSCAWTGHQMAVTSGLWLKRTFLFSFFFLRARMPPLHERRPGRLAKLPIWEKPLPPGLPTHQINTNLKHNISADWLQTLSGLKWDYEQERDQSLVPHPLLIEFYQPDCFYLVSREGSWNNCYYLSTK